MSELSNFDQFIKNKLGDYSPDVPAHIWENIIAEKKRKRPVPFFFQLLNNKKLLLIAGLLFVSVAGIVIYSKTQLNIAQQDTSVINTQPAVNDKFNTPAKSSATTLNNNQNQPNGELTNTQAQKNVNDDKVRSIDASNQVSSYNNILTHNTTKGRTEDNMLPQKISKGKSKKYHSKTNDTDAFDDLTTVDIVDHLKDVKQKSYPDNLILFKMLFHPEKNKTGFTLSNTISSNIFLPPCPEVERNAAGNKDYIEAYIGPDFAYKSYESAFGDSAGSVLLQKRKESISFHSAFSAGFRYTRVFSNGVSFRGGINFSQINEKFSYVQSNVVQVTYIIDAVTGDTTGSYITNGTRYKTIHNHYRSFDVPLSIGFETGNGRVHANFNTGVVFNIYSWQKGESLDSTLQPVSITTGKGAAAYQYKTNIGAGLITAASIYYKLNDRFHLLAEPYWRYNFAPISKEIISFQEKFSTIGLRLGIRMDLNY